MLNAVLTATPNLLLSYFVRIGNPHRRFKKYKPISAYLYYNYYSIQFVTLSSGYCFNPTNMCHISYTTAYIATGTPWRLRSYIDSPDKSESSRKFLVGFFTFWFLNGSLYTFSLYLVQLSRSVSGVPCPQIGIPLIVTSFFVLGFFTTWHSLNR